MVLVSLKPFLKKGRLLFSRQVDGACRIALEERVEKADDFGLTPSEDQCERCKKICIRGIVGPKRENTLGMQLEGEFSEPGLAIKGAVTEVKQVFGGVVDIQEDRVEEASRCVGIESLFGIGGQREEIAMDKSVARIGGELGAERHQALFVPFDDGRHEINDEERAQGGMLEGGARCVSEAEATDDDVEMRLVEQSQSKVREGDFDFVKQAGHEEGVTEFHLKNLKIVEFRHAPAAESQLSKGRLAVVQFFKRGAHPAQGREGGAGWEAQSRDYGVALRGSVSHVQCVRGDGRR